MTARGIITRDADEIRWVSPDGEFSLTLDTYDEHRTLTVVNGSESWIETGTDAEMGAEWDRLRDEWRSQIIEVGCDHEIDGQWDACTEETVDERHEGVDYPPA